MKSQLLKISGVGQFGDDDLYVICSSREIEILFCQQKDLHLRYNDSNKLATHILDLWRRKDLLHPNGR